MRHEQYRTAVLKGEKTPEVKAHLDRCLACARLARALALLQEVPPPPPGLEQRLLERLGDQREAGAEARRTAAPGVWNRIPAWLGVGPARRRLPVLLAVLALVIASSLVVLSALGPGDYEAVALIRFTQK